MLQVVVIGSYQTVQKIRFLEIRWRLTFTRVRVVLDVVSGVALPAKSGASQRFALQDEFCRTEEARLLNFLFFRGEPAVQERFHLLTRRGKSLREVAGEKKAVECFGPLGLEGFAAPALGVPNSLEADFPVPILETNTVRLDRSGTP